MLGGDRRRGRRPRARGLRAERQRGKPTPAKDLSDTDKTLIWANWPAYLDEDDDGNYPTLERFIEETGIEVDYRVDVDDNNSYYAKVKDQLALGQDIGADLVCLTDWMVSRLIRFGYTQELDHANIPNIANLNPDLAEHRLRPGTHAVPAVAGRLRRHLLEQGGGAGRPPLGRATSGTRSSRAASAC